MASLAMPPVPHGEPRACVHVGMHRHAQHPSVSDGTGVHVMTMHSGGKQQSATAVADQMRERDRDWGAATPALGLAMAQLVALRRAQASPCARTTARPAWEATCSRARGASTLRWTYPRRRRRAAATRPRHVYEHSASHGMTHAHTEESGCMHAPPPREHASDGTAACDDASQAQ